MRSTDIGSPYLESPEFVFKTALSSSLSRTPVKKLTGKSDRPIMPKAMPVLGACTYLVIYGFFGMYLFSQLLFLYVKREQRLEHGLLNTHFSCRLDE